MTDVLHTFEDTLEDHRGVFRGCVIGGQAGDGTWEGWLEFAPANDAESLLVTDVESRQQTHMELARWASGLTPVYAQRALHRAHPAVRSSEAVEVPDLDRPSTDLERRDLRKRLRDLIAALDRRVPHFGRDGEHAIVRDAAALKQQAEDRIKELE